MFGISGPSILPVILVAGACGAVLNALAVAAVAGESWRADLTLIGDRYAADAGAPAREDEHEVVLALGRRLASRWTAVGVLSLEHRFGADDRLYEGWLYTPGVGPAYGWIAAGVAPANEFMPDRQAEVGAEAEWATGFAATARLRLRDYPGERLWLPGGELRQRLLSWLTAELGSGATISDRQPTTFTTLAALRWQAQAFDGRVFVNRGEENNPPLPVSRVLVIGTMLRWATNERLSWRGDLAWEDRSGLYRRWGGAITATVRF